MAGHPLCLFKSWHPGCPHPSTGMLSIFQPSQINPGTTPPFSFHLPICPSWLHRLLPHSNRFRRHRPWILLLRSGVRDLRLQVISHPRPSPCSPLLHLAPCIDRLVGLHFLSLCVLSSLSLHRDHDHGHTQTVWKFRPLLTFTPQIQTAASLTDPHWTWLQMNNESRFSHRLHFFLHFLHLFEPVNVKHTSQHLQIAREGIL